MIRDEIRDYYRNDVVTRFLRYVQIYTTSDETNPSTPSTERQWTLLRMLESELREIGLDDVLIDDHGYVYGTLSSNVGNSTPSFGLLAHVDTSPDQPGENVKPRQLKSWDGSAITFPDDPALTLTIADSPELADFIGKNIITASGKTLLGADDKAGVAEIMSAMATFKRFPDLEHGDIRVCFTPDEEIGRGTIELNLERLPKFCYTLDGGYPGELECECFDAWRADIEFKGVGVHPGYAKNKMINAIAVASRFCASIPEWESPERTELREGFYHLASLEGDFENARLWMILRDFEEDNNKKRMDFLEALKVTFEKRYPGLKIDLAFKHQYQNMRDLILESPEVVEFAAKAIEQAGIQLIRKSIRGGTDGSRLTQLGHPTPNIFAGGLMFHSRREWVAEWSMEKAVETILHLAHGWAHR